MKKFFSIGLICLLAGFFIFGQGQAQTNTEECRIYFVDRRLHRLIPLPFSSQRTPEKTAKEMVSAIIAGRDSNTEILRLFPNIENSITVRLSGNTAYVNLSSELTTHINKNAETERLFVYQIANSLVSIKGIDYVQFTIDNETKKEFLGFLDMREIFTADYYM
jgi:hypothetical protein